MNIRFAPLALASLLLVRVVHADDSAFAHSAAQPKNEIRAGTTSEPPSGIGLLVTGSILTADAAANLAGASLCQTGLVTDNNRSRCWALALGFVGVLAAVGVPLLVIGAGQRARHADWERTHPGATASAWSVTPVGGGALLSLTIRTD
jgi:hypothetical protein